MERRMLSSLVSRAKRRLAKSLYAPAIEVQHANNLLRLGSTYGGWTFEPSADLQGCTVISCGLGEDASFDTEFASKFGAKVIIVDPTPRAIRHFAEIQERLGKAAAQSYVPGGKQPAAAYELSKLTKESLILEPYALWVEAKTLKFFAPQNPDHVSHSIVNYQNEYSQDTAFIEVPAITPETLLSRHQLKTVPLMKLDIEGAEIEVIRHLIEKSVLPRQILVEFDEMNFPTKRSKANAENTDKLLKQAGYSCRYFDGLANFLYVLR
jgi:FkbM family methyltransferase